MPVRPARIANRPSGSRRRSSPRSPRPSAGAPRAPNVRGPRVWPAGRARPNPEPTPGLEPGTPSLRGSRGACSWLRLIAPSGCAVAFQAVGGSPVLARVQGVVLPTCCPLAPAGARRASTYRSRTLTRACWPRPPCRARGVPPSGSGCRRPTRRPGRTWRRTSARSRPSPASPPHPRPPARGSR